MFEPMPDPVMTQIPIAQAYAGAGSFKPWFATGTKVAAPVTDDPYSRGLADGQALAEDRFAAERTRYNALIASANALQNESSEELAVLIGETVERLVCDIVGAMPIDSDQLNRQALKAVALIAQCDDARTMWVHPDDLVLLDAAAIELELAADPEAERGSIRIDCSAGWIEHGRAHALNELRVVLGISGEMS